MTLNTRAVRHFGHDRGPHVSQLQARVSPGRASRDRRTRTTKVRRDEEAVGAAGKRARTMGPQPAFGETSIFESATCYASSCSATYRVCSSARGEKIPTGRDVRWEEGTILIPCNRPGGEARAQWKNAWDVERTDKVRDRRSHDDGLVERVQHAIYTCRSIYMYVLIPMDHISSIVRMGLTSNCGS